jgi:LysM repeat protein
MSFTPNRRFWVATIAAIAVAIFLSWPHHNSASVPSTVDKTVFATPSVGTPTPIAPTKPSVAAYFEAVPADVIDLKKIRSGHVDVKVYQVELGENYWTLAKEANIDVPTLIGANPAMPFKAVLHQTLFILSRKGVLHTVHPEETLSQIAEEYRTTEEVIRKENGLHWWHPMRAWDVLFIPGARPIRMVKEWHEYFGKRGMFGVPFSQWATWTSGFGLRVDPVSGEERSHKGIDLRAKYGSAVYASAAGKVIFTGISGGYGNLIQIAHGNGFITFYGHLSKILVKPGEHVRRGTLIGRVGATGRVTGPHLHFEIRKNGKAVDPLQYI